MTNKHADQMLYNLYIFVKVRLYPLISRGIRRVAWRICRSGHSLDRSANPGVGVCVLHRAAHLGVRGRARRRCKAAWCRVGESTVCVDAGSRQDWWFGRKGGADRWDFGVTAVVGERTLAGVGVLICRLPHWLFENRFLLIQRLGILGWVEGGIAGAGVLSVAPVENRQNERRNPSSCRKVNRLLDNDGAILTEYEPEEDGSGLFRAAPAIEASLEVVTFIGIRIVVCILAPCLSESRNNSDKA